MLRKTLLVVYTALALGANAAHADVAGLREGDMKKLAIHMSPAPVPEAVLLDAEDGEHALAEYRGKWVVLNFWATWCAPCTQEMPALASLAKSLKGKPAEVVAISVDKPEDRDFAIGRLAQLTASTLAFYHEPSYAIAFDAEAKGFPTTIIYARDGRELARLSGGEVDWATPEATRLVEAALTK